MRLVADGLGATRGGIELFSEVSFSIASGQGLIITGANGAGKSTLLRIIAGLLRPSSGSIGLVGKDGEFQHEAFHFLSTQNGMKDQLSSAENLAFWKHFLPNHPSGSAMTADQALSSVGLSHIGDLPFGYLSTGQRRRVALARLLVTHRPLWLVDEPTSGLDKPSETLFADIARAHLSAGGMVAAATHLDLGISGLQHLSMGEAK